MQLRAGAIAGTLLVGAALAAALYRNQLEPIAGSSPLAACQLAATDAAHPGMVFIPAGNFMMGANYAYPEEGPSHAVTVGDFWIDQTEVTNGQFAEFVAATGYRTLAERGIGNPAQPQAAPVAGSAVFVPPYTDGQPDPFRSWWQFRLAANWRQPAGPGSSIAGLEQHPVVHIAFEDAQAYAAWKGHSLPTEAQFEYAARGTGREDADGNQIANTWQGLFPFQHDSSDGYIGTSPVGCYATNAQGVYDLIGNVWEWTSSTYYISHDFAAKADFPGGYDPNQPTDEVAVIKGGSYLCAPNYCMRYRPEARQGQSKGLGTDHIGFRTVMQAQAPN